MPTAPRNKIKRPSGAEALAAWAARSARGQRRRDSRRPGELLMAEPRAVRVGPARLGADRRGDFLQRPSMPWAGRKHVRPGPDNRDSIRQFCGPSFLDGNRPARMISVDAVRTPLFFSFVAGMVNASSPRDPSRLMRFRTSVSAKGPRRLFFGQEAGLAEKLPPRKNCSKPDGRRRWVEIQKNFQKKTVLFPVRPFENRPLR